jgi:small subunit ribosomal protein S7
MPRRREVAKREPQPDPIYNSGLVSFFINVVMKQGKKSTAEQLVYGAFDKIRDRTQEDPLTIFKKAVDNVKPTLEVKSRRVGGSNYQVRLSRFVGCSASLVLVRRRPWSTSSLVSCSMLLRIGEER